MKDRLFDQVKKAQEAASAKADELKSRTADRAASQSSLG
jgi:hypothetical protein